MVADLVLMLEMQKDCVLVITRVYVLVIVKETPKV